MIDGVVDGTNNATKCATRSEALHNVHIVQHPHHEADTDVSHGSDLFLDGIEEPPHDVPCCKSSPKRPERA